MSVEKVYTEQEKAMVQALAKIQELCRPGQSIDVNQAIDIICDCYNIAKNAIEQVTK